MKRNISVLLTILILILSIVLSGCGILKSNENKNDGKLKITATLFPLYDFARQITGDMAEVSLLLPPGVEAHSYEPTPRDIMDLEKADVFIYTGEFMEPWAHKVIEKVKNENLVVINSGDKITLIEEQHKHESHEEHTSHDEHTSHEEETSHEEHESHSSHEDESSHDHEDNDPHIWVDPVLAIKIVENILEGIVSADPDNADLYNENTLQLKNKLQKLHEDFTDLSNRAKIRTIIHGGHFAFGYFAKRYNLEYISPYEGFSPNSEPTTQRIAQLIENLKNSGTNVIYYEELIEPRVARIISDQAGAQMLMLHAAHNISRLELDEGITYFDIMYQNLENLKIGLGYE